MATNTSITITNTSTEIVEAKSGRQAMILQNVGTSDVYLAFGEAATLDKGLLVGPGTILTLSDEIDIELLQEGLFGIVSSGTNLLLLIQK